MNGDAVMLAGKMAVLLAAAWCGHLMLARANARWRVMLWRGTTAGILAVVLFHGAPVRWTWNVPMQQPGFFEEGREGPTVSDSRETQSKTRGATAGADEEVAAASAETAATAAGSTGGGRGDPSPWVLLWGVYTVVALGLSARLAAGWVRVKGWRRAASPVDDETRLLAEEAARLSGVENGISVYTLENLSTPFLTGLRRPRIFLPSRMLDADHREELLAVFCHELTHWRHQDVAWGLVLRLVRIALWWNPLAWRIPSAHASACEEVADATTAELLGDRDRYTRTLARIAVEMVSLPPNAALGVPMARVPEVSRRLRALKQGRRALPLSRRQIASFAIAGLCVVALLGTLRLAATARQAPPEPAADTSQQTAEKAQLQDLIDQAKAGGVVELEPGVYRGPAEITKALTLKAASAGNVTIEHLGQEPAVYIRADDVALENITVRWAPEVTGQRMEFPAAVAVHDSKGVVLDGCRLEPLDRPEQTPGGLLVTGRGDATFTNGSTFGFAYAILYTNGANGAVTNSILTGAGHSVVTLHEYSNVRIENNVLAQCGYHAVRNTGGTMEMVNNLVADNVRAGAYLGNKSAHGRIANNLFSGSKGSIWGYAQSDVLIEHNLFYRSKATAIGAWLSCELGVERNSFVENPSAMTRYPRPESLMTKAGPPTDAGMIASSNHYWKNDSEPVDMTKGEPAWAGDPWFRDPPNGDFTPEGGSLLYGKDGAIRAGLAEPAAILPLWKKYEDYKTAE